MSENELVIYEHNFDQFAKDVEQMTTITKQLMGTKHYTSLGEAGIFAILQSAKALKLDPFQCLNGALYIVKGKIGMSSEMMASLIRRAGHSVAKDPKSNDKICILHGKRNDTGDTWTSSFSIEDATKAGINGIMYNKYPAIMLYNRAMSALARQLFPDVINGFGYCKEELEEIAVEETKREEKKAPKISNHTIDVPVTPIISQELEDELIALLLENLTLKKLVDNLLDKRGTTVLSQLPYEDFMKILTRARKEKGANSGAKNTAME